VRAADGARDGSVSPDPPPSIYDLDIPLVESDGRRTTLAALRGGPVIAAMIYTSCASVCPRTVEDMKAIERQLPPESRRGLTFALFSLDPGRDTPAALRRFAAERGLDASTWRLFAASEDSVRTLAAVLGVRYAREPSGEVAHSALIALVDGSGVVRHRQIGLAGGPDPLLRAVRSAGAQPF
jgi:protein SCO1/2